VVESVRRYRPWLIEPHVPEIILEPLCEADLPVLAYYQRTTADALTPMLAAARSRLHEGRYYEAFGVRVNGCLTGLVSLLEQPDGTVSGGADTFLPFRQCGFAFRALTMLTDVARERGFTVQTAQIRTDNAASIALHSKLGFVPGEPWVNRRGHEVCTWRKEL